MTTKITNQNQDNAITDADNQEFTVYLALSEEEYTVPADKSILQTLADADVPVISSCQEGTCGTCETPVLEGEVDHRCRVLDEEEREANESMMICVSRAKCSRLVLDM
ncbi:ferredoxin [Corynebacterium maris DSM 45190]|uniref:Ferredoxin n=1 Tax=Corynebacterium maris DSM 45190 TaxID=1224163 RepID=S5SW99_9CORY|nr:2Fe-2S iron-sulfur cluster binding domain-containing protein [Corynebacterium maris]AGS35362.1 ferredoxin [Corynebacterium maris DSM 45190]